ncbi:alpha/beta hydrolase family esterase [Carboxylicivirga taeanensis]|uniref:alpha/beta hydrolase family esterase n=1 Tax=Carboxylicivirga taeanensis TaxID=1416875 RepID=UPI003F6E1ECD
MKKIKNLLYILLVCSLFAVSCSDDESNGFAAQLKEIVEVEEIEKEQGSGNETGLDLSPGIHKDTITLENVTYPERIFKYYFPKSLDLTKPISLLFRFHGSTESNPIDGISESHYMNQLANKENIIVVFPLGSIQEGTNTINWTADENVLFFDAMVEYFKSKKPAIDPNRIYACGQSSGAIFSYRLAMERSEVVAAIAPVAGQYAIRGEDFVQPSRVVPIRAFNGMLDDIVLYSAVENNIAVWAEQVGGYWQEATGVKTEIIDDYMVDVTFWANGSNDIQLYGIKGEGHGVNWSKVMPYMWEFLEAHTLDGSSSSYITLAETPVRVMFGTTRVVEYKLSPNTSMALKSYPQGWLVSMEPGLIQFTAPAQGVGETSGDVVLTLTNADGTADKIISVEGKETDGYNIGDFIVSNDRWRDPWGVVYWVDKYDRYKAKIISAAGNDAGTPWADRDTGEEIGATSVSDGQANSDIIRSVYNLDASQCAAEKCYSYQYRAGFYLPAINELAEALQPEVVEKVNLTLEARGYIPISTSALYWSSTESRRGEDGLNVICRSVDGGKDVITGYNNTEVRTRGIKKLGNWD